MKISDIARVITDNASTSTFYGIRALNDEQNVLGVGDYLNNSLSMGSHEANTDEDGNEVYCGGTCVVGIVVDEFADFADEEEVKALEASIAKAIKQAKIYARGANTRYAVVAGGLSNHGDDDGEYVLTDAQILGFLA